ncbi:MAG: hypothetical protein CM1200mP2_00010 [Planctomycetaceae bacterium]|nr:MAG: hypothetical protein CM1200mP2_00010 [Planctomycetaceae bacterium]
MIGGVTVEGQGRTTLPGLWAAGEVTSTGLQGAQPPGIQQPRRRAGLWSPGRGGRFEGSEIDSRRFRSAHIFARLRPLRERRRRIEHHGPEELAVEPDVAAGRHRANRDVDAGSGRKGRVLGRVRVEPRAERDGGMGAAESAVGRSADDCLGQSPHRKRGVHLRRDFPRPTLRRRGTSTSSRRASRLRRASRSRCDAGAGA